MSGNREEVEVKLPFPSASEALVALQALGARITHPRVFEDNFVYDQPDRSLRSSRRLLRLRRSGGASIVTFKAPGHDSSRYKVRSEVESLVGDADAFERILQGLGYERVYRYQKYRTVLELEGIVATVDETPIGCWVELEGNPAGIDSVAERLGYQASDYVRASYRDLHEDIARERGTPVGDLVFPTGGAGDR